MDDCVAIVSGGMDSVTMLHYLVKQEALQPAVLSFKYGQKHSKEVEFVEQHIRMLGLTTHEIVDLSNIVSFFNASALISDKIDIPDIQSVLGDPQPATYVPNRNMIFLALGAAYAESIGLNAIYYGAQAHDLYGYWDTTPEFLDKSISTPSAST